MSQQKGLLTRLGETLDQYRAERRASAQPRRWRWLGRQIMPNIGTLLLVAVLILTQNVWARQTAGPASPGPSATTVNYQGRLANSDGTPLTEEGVAMSFAIYDAKEDGNLIWPADGEEDHVVDVSDGLFSVPLGSETGGGIPTMTWNGDRYLEITVSGETLAPRELIRSVPIAGMALTVPDEAINTAQLSSNSVTNSQSVVLGPNDGLLTTNSQTFSDISGCEITMQTTGGPVLLLFQGNIRGDHSDVGDAVNLDFAIDGVRVSGAERGLNRIVSAGPTENASTMWLAQPPAGTHTFTVQWRIDTDETTEATLNQGNFASQFTVVELKR